MKTMAIILTSNEESTDKAAKFASEIDKPSAEWSNNEVSPASIGEFLVQDDGTSILKGGFQCIPERRAFEKIYERRFENTPFNSPDCLNFGVNGTLTKKSVKVFRGDSQSSIGGSIPGMSFKPPSHGAAAKVTIMSSNPLAKETLSLELRRFSNMLGSFHESEYAAMYAI